MHRLLTAAALLLVVPASATAASTGTSSEGARFRLDGQVVTVVLPKPLRPGRVVEVECGRELFQRRTVGTGRTRGRGLRTVRVRLRGPVEGAEWCEYTGPRLARGAAPLSPGALSFERLVAGPGVRTARSDERDREATFHLRGSLVTVELDRPFSRSTVAGLGCGSGDEPIGGRRVAVRAGQRVVSVDGEANLDAATWCILEAPGGADVAAVDLG